MIENARASERFAVVGSAIGTASSTPLTSDYHLAGKERRYALIVQLSDMASETIDVQIFDATDSSGTSAAAQKSATQLTAHATNNDGKIVIVNIDESEIDPAKPYIAGRVTTGAGVGGTVCMFLLAFDGRHGPITDANIADVVQTVS